MVGWLYCGLGINRFCDLAIHQNHLEKRELMMAIDEVAKVIVNDLNPKTDEEVEKKKLNEKDEKAMVVECLHHSTVTLTNGSIQCRRCLKMLKVIEPKWR